MLAVTGDSIALGLSAYLRPRPAIVEATVGIGSAAAAPRIPRAGRLVVSLGVNDDDRYGLPAFRRAVTLARRRSSCALWLTVRHHPRHDRVLRATARRFSDFVLVPATDVPTVDGIHPTPEGYRVLARREAARSC